MARARIEIEGLPMSTRTFEAVMTYSDLELPVVIESDNIPHPED